MDILSDLDDVLESRKGDSAKSSYVASLYAAGAEKITGKVSEEAGELVKAAFEEDRNHIVSEAADLWFHTMVLLSYYDLTHNDVLLELEKRFGVSGLEEKKSRKFKGKCDNT